VLGFFNKCDNNFIYNISIGVFSQDIGGGGYVCQSKGEVLAKGFGGEVAVKRKEDEAMCTQTKQGEPM
jgi:hypothetical protein